MTSMDRLEGARARARGPWRSRDRWPCCWPLVAASGCARNPRWNVVVVTFDTTRADHIGCYGRAAARTPNVDRLAREGVRFETSD